MTKYLNYFEFESGFTEVVEAGELFYPNVSYTEDNDTVHWNLEQPADPVETPMLRMSFSTQTPGQEVLLHAPEEPGFENGITAIEIDGTPVDYNASGGTYIIASPGNHTAGYYFSSSKIPEMLFLTGTNEFSAFTSAEITSAVTEIGGNAFAGCKGLTSVTIPDSVTTIWGQAFSDCSGISSVTIPDSVTTIDVRAFGGTGLRHVTVPDTVTLMGPACFEDCTEMLSAIIGSGITVISSRMFTGCTSLQSVTLPGNLTTIGKMAFSGCSSLHDINIPSGVTTIGEIAFDYSGLRSVTVPDSVTELSEECFAHCGDLQSAVIGSGVTTIGERAFSGCSGLTEIYFNPETPPTLGTGALDNTNGCPIYVPASSVETYKQSWSAYASRITSTGGGEPDQYNISASVNHDSLGEVLLNQETANEGDRVQFIVSVYEEPDYQVTAVSITDENGDEVEYTDEGANNYEFEMPASDVSIFATIEAAPTE